MLWLCQYTLNPGVTQYDLDLRVLRIHDEGMGRPDARRGIYLSAEVGQGFWMFDLNTPREVAGLLDAYADLARWRVSCVYEKVYNQVIQERRAAAIRSCQVHERA
jgi:hypothetical protein